MRTGLLVTVQSTVGLFSRTALIATLIVAAPLAAQEQPQEIQGDSLHFAFANYLSAGIYSVGGRTIQVYRFPVPIQLTSEEQWSLSLSIPLTLGLYDLQAGQDLVLDIPNRFASISVIPRLLLSIRATPHWTVGPFVDFGAAKDFDSDRTTYVYGIGAIGEAVYPVGSYELRPLVKLLWVQHSAPVTVFGDDLGKLELGLETRFPMGFAVRGQPADLGVFAMSHSYLNDLRLSQPGQVPFQLTQQWEIGVSIGTRPQFKILGAKMPRVGLSYRFGDNVAAVRIILGKPM